jgi:N-acetyl-gamma-glutamyl-phosphate reductase
MSLIQVGVIGASGFVGAELISILLKHSQVEIAGISSAHHEGQAFSELYPAYIGNFEKTFEANERVIEASEVVFFCLPHGKSEAIVKKCLEAGKKVIDIGADFRLKDVAMYEEWYGVKVQYPKIRQQSVYGLTEFNRKAITQTQLVANPGCYPTSMLLGLYPIIQNGLGDPSTIIVDAKSGVTGAGKSLSETLHFANKNEGFKAYKVASHRHTPEVEENLEIFGADNAKISFVPHLLPVNRGILSTIYIKKNEQITREKIYQAYENAYKQEPFVQVLPQGSFPDIGDVIHSNQCHIGITVDERTDQIIIVSVIDNMQKGAAGQAVQNFNVMLGLEETEGLSMVAPSF